MKSDAPQFNGPPPSAPPSYSEAVGGVPHTNTYVYHSVHPGPQIITAVVPVGPQSTHMLCPQCYAEIDTTTKTAPGLIAYVFGTILCLIGCFCGCCLIPCCIPSFMDVRHSCPNCKAYLGRYRR